ncbi:MAG: ABC transporter permease [Planctomycetota bacterium]|jgi:ribose transport system permease protein|nr:ABC transporter permease [Planctomycetota bacterium]
MPDAARTAGKNPFVALLAEYNKFLFPVSLIILMFGIGQAITGGFSSPANINNILTISCVVAVATFAQSFVIMAGDGGIDLSVGSIMSMSALLVPAVTAGEMSRLPVAIVLVLALAAVFGAANAAGVLIVGIPSLVMTFIMASAVDGFSLSFTRGQPTGLLPEVLLALGRPAFFGIRWILVITVVIAVIAELFLRRTRTGKQIFLVGSNRNAACLCGIGVNRIVFIAYIMSACLAALGGILLVGYSGSSILKMANGYTMLSVPAAVIGGVNLAGGEGNMFSGFLGAIIFTLLSNLLIAVGIPNGVRILIQGAALLFILVMYARDAKLRQ